MLGVCSNDCVKFFRWIEKIKNSWNEARLPFGLNFNKINSEINFQWVRSHFLVEKSEFLIFCEFNFLDLIFCPFFVVWNSSMNERISKWMTESKWVRASLNVCSIAIWNIADRTKTLFFTVPKMGILAFKIAIIKLLLNIDARWCVFYGAKSVFFQPSLLLITFDDIHY